ncbi:hypothetical protein GCM10023340_01300 [Nocardioides marinquilinus]|uniref:Uncharacterized protein n=1 Tax=Nocardioides marinquilinus TaxID=1210400 RepID=A0ABP9P9H2_9ACTN
MPLRRLVVAVVAGVLLVGVVTFALVRGGVDDDPAPAARTAPPSPADPTQPTEAPAPEPVAEDGVECPAPRRMDGYRDLAEETPLPDGAVALRLCATADSEARWIVPPDVLVGAVAGDLVGQMQQGELVKGDVLSCTAVGGADFAYAVGFADGTRRIMVGATGGCGIVKGAGPARFGGRDVADAYFEALGSARAVSPTPSRTPPRPTCFGHRGYALSPQPEAFDVRLEDAVSAAVCWDPREVGDEVVYREAALDPDDLATVLADHRTPGRSPGGCRVGNFVLIYGTHWGDVGAALTRCGRWDIDGTAEQLMGAAAVDVFRPIVGGHRKPRR